MTPDLIQRIDARRNAQCRHPTAASGKFREYLLCHSCGVDFYDGELEVFEAVPPKPFAYATDEQAARIDAQRSGECKHERASERRPWCLICQRCGVNFCDGRLGVIDRKSEADDAKDGVERLCTLGYEQ